VTPLTEATFMGGCNGYSNCNSRLSPRIHAPASVRSLSSNPKSHPVLLHHTGVLLTRVCVQFQQVLGEKCVRCGVEAVPVHADAHSNAHAGQDFECLACRHRFSRGEGGETGGMCEPCFDAALQKAHEPQEAGRQ
jgi:hypothetical protein